MTDWEDGDSSGFQSKTSTSFGGGFGRGGFGRGGLGKSEGGFGSGLGRARGKRIQNDGFGNSNGFRESGTDNWNQSGSRGGGFGSSNGFGSGDGLGDKGRGFGGSFGSSNGGGGFGSKSTTNGDDWGDGGGFGGSSGGFGSSSGFGRSEDSEAPRGGGFSSRSGGFGGGDRREGFRTGRGSAFEGGNNFDADFDYFKQPSDSDETHTMSKGTYGYRKSKLDKAFTSNGANLKTTCSFGKQTKMASRSGFGQPRKSNDGNSKEGGGGSGGGCYKCGGDGHFARECPNSDSSSGNPGGRGKGCFKCGEEGHMSRECPNNASGGGGRSRACFKCGEEGHMSRECPNGDSSGGGGGRSRACYKCGEEGHMSRECPSSESSGGRGGGGGGECYKCGQTGHFARECPNSESSGDRSGGFGGRSGGGGGGGGGGSSGACFKCNEEGHMARDCPNAGEEEKKREPNYIPPAPSEDEEAIFLSMQRGINFDKYDEIPVECTGNGAPQRGISSFDEADFSPLFRENVRKANYEKPTPVQKWAIPIIRKGHDLMACAQTGSGKTAAFLLPVLTGMVEKGCGGGSMQETQTPMAIIIGPTRELVLQIYNEARKFAHGSMIRPVVVYGGTSVQHQLSMLQRGANMVIGTPGRLVDFITRGRISLSEVKYMILDEADRMLDMGFGPEVRKIVEENGMPSKEDRQTLMFSATFPEDIQRLARDFLNNYLFVTVGRVGSANTDIKQTVHCVSQYDKREKLVEILNESGQDRVLVFVETKRQADFIASYLSQSQFPTTSIHGDRLQREREEALADFKTGKAPILVATSVAARGLDIPGVKHVINFDLPSGIDEYVHRIGRTGRCGNLGKASSFYDPDKNSELARSLVKVLEDATQEVPQFLESAAEQGTGTGFSGVGGKFGGRDTRRGNFGASSGNAGGDDWGGDSGGFGGGFSSTNNVEEESWD